MHVTFLCLPFPYERREGETRPVHRAAALETLFGRHYSIFSSPGPSLSLIECVCPNAAAAKRQTGFCYSFPFSVH